MKKTLSHNFAQKLTLTTALSTALLFAAPAMAQTAPSAEEDANRDADIIVTAQKFEQKSVDVPITISAVTGSGLRNWACPIWTNCPLTSPA